LQEEVDKLTNWQLLPRFIRNPPLKMTALHLDVPNTTFIRHHRKKTLYEIKIGQFSFNAHIFDHFKNLLRPEIIYIWIFTSFFEHFLMLDLFLNLSHV
jgi:hypothetical protein